MNYEGPERREPDELHWETRKLVKEVHDLEYQKMHPDINHILDALCGPVDALSGTREIEKGINGKIDRVELEVESMSARVTDLHKNGAIRFSKQVSAR